MEKFETTNIVFIKSKKTENYKKTKDDLTYKKNYGIIDKNNKRFSFELHNASIPFGIEKYNFQNIVNIKLYPNKNNDHHNIISIIKKIEDIAEKKNFNDNEILSNIQNKNFYSNLKQINDYYIMRTYIIGAPITYMMINDKKYIISENDIKGKNINVEIELGTLWITDNDYGLLFYTRSIRCN